MFYHSALGIDQRILTFMEFNWVSDSLGTEAILLLASFVLSGIIGVEREIQHKSAGARTHILVGMGAALFTLVSAYGFDHVLSDTVVLDPSRIAAQIVSGIGFLGAGVIFVRRNIVSGLTTAASVWVTAAVGMACGAGMPTIAAITVALYIVAATILAPLMRRLPDPSRSEVYTVYYSDGYGVLRDVLQLASDEGYDVALSETTRQSTAEGPVVGAVMRFTRGKQRPAEPLFRRLSELEGVLEIKAEDQDRD